LANVLNRLARSQPWEARSSRECAALSQMQNVVLVVGAAESIVELLALRLDEQGTKLSTPWPQEPSLRSPAD
jgi:hypothetical protein